MPPRLMLPFKIIYSDRYYLPLGDHVFPGEKYRLVRQRLIESGVASAEDFLEPEPARDEDILLVHTPEYVQKLKSGTLSAREQAALEIPYSPQLVEAFWLAAGGSILAAQRALTEGRAVNLGGGFHHAYPDHGEGFCAIHDVAVAIRVAQHKGALRDAMVVDCDVHQGNGSAAIFASPAGAIRSTRRLELSTGTAVLQSQDPGNVFTLSMHQAANYPAYKPPSSLDVDLPDGVSDADYLETLESALDLALAHFAPGLLCYIAGADPYAKDQLGGLALTIEGLRQRDALVFQVAARRGIPVMVTLAGGYAVQVEDTVRIHCNTVSALAAAGV